MTVYFKTNNPTYQDMRCGLYKASDLSFVAETEERTIEGHDWGWRTFNFITPPNLEANTEYLLCFWAAGIEYWTIYNSGSTDQTCRDIEAYDGFPSTFTKDNSWDEKTSIYCTYSISNIAPNIGDFSSSDDPVYSNSWFNVNCTLNDEDGISELKNSTLQLSEDIILGWDNSSSTFSIEYDPNGYCTLNSSASIEHELNSTAFELSWRIQLSQGYPHGSSVDIVADNTTVYDTEGASGSGSHSRLFVFEPEESGEPGAVTGGTVRKKTPLEELGVPTPFPYEVAPPEAQYGSIGLVVILTGGVIYYIRRPKTTQQLFRENTASRVKYGPRKPRKRGIKTKKAPKRRVHSKK